MLALATAVAILALLLAGTVKGLRSYYLTMQSIKCKLAELDDADKFKSVIENLRPPDGIAETEKYRDARIALDSRITEAKKALNHYERNFEETLRLDLAPLDDGDHIAGLIAKLRNRFATLDRLSHRPDTDLTGDTTRVWCDSYFEPIREEVQMFGKEADDLRAQVREGLAASIGRSRNHYQTSLWILIPSSILSLVLMLSSLRFFYGWVFNPIRDLRNGVATSPRGDFDHRIEVHSGDEMEELASAFNDMMRDCTTSTATWPTRSTNAAGSSSAPSAWPVLVFWPQAWPTRSTTRWRASPSAARRSKRGSASS